MQAVMSVVPQYSSSPLPFMFCLLQVLLQCFSMKLTVITYVYKNVFSYLQEVFSLVML